MFNRVRYVELRSDFLPFFGLSGVLSATSSRSEFLDVILSLDFDLLCAPPLRMSGERATGFLGFLAMAGVILLNTRAQRPTCSTAAGGAARADGV